MTYEQPNMRIIVRHNEDIIRTSNVVPGAGIPELDEEDWEKVE